VGNSYDQKELKGSRRAAKNLTLPREEGDNRGSQSTKKKKGRRRREEKFSVSSEGLKLVPEICRGWRNLPTSIGRCTFPRGRGRKNVESQKRCTCLSIGQEGALRERTQTERSKKITRPAITQRSTERDAGGPQRRWDHRGKKVPTTARTR